MFYCHDTRFKIKTLSVLQLTSSDLVTWQGLFGGGGGGANNSAVNIIGMEDDDDSDCGAMGVNPVTEVSAAASVLDPTAAEEVEAPFKNVRDLFCHSAHLSVFVNYILSNSDSAALVSHKPGSSSSR